MPKFKSEWSGDKNGMSPSILYSSPDNSIILLDIPRTLELAQQAPPGDLNHASGGDQDPPPDRRRQRRILSAQPVTEPYATPEPKAKGSGAQNKSPALQVADLMTAAAVQSALEHVRGHYAGPWLLPRVVGDDPVVAAPGYGFLLPDGAQYVQGSLGKTSNRLRDEAPCFDLMVLDPPWANRSARRKTDSYSTVYNMSDMKQLLDNVPVQTHLKSHGLVAMWITNKSSVLEGVTSPTGLFASWGLEMVAEWTWLKITADGEPIYDLDSEWRKPWEKLLIAKRKGAPTPENLTFKTILASPDLHSRKPNLRSLFDDILGAAHTGLEVFARNLTVGWWAWGDEPLRFQVSECWTDAQDEVLKRD